MNSHNTRFAIGGEFELHMPAFGSPDQLRRLTFGLTGTWTASGRSALALILRRLRRAGVHHVHLPSYLCRSIVLPLEALNLEYSFYRVDDTLTAHPDPPSGAAVLLIHYFGWLNPSTAALSAEAGKSLHLIEDASQALLSDLRLSPDDERLIFTSPRKFGPIPLGGWCNVSVEPDEPSTAIEALAWRSLTARLVRGRYMSEPGAPVDTPVEEFYLKAFHAVEEFLDTHPTSAHVPRIVLEITAGLDWKQIAQRRRANWLILNELLHDTIDALTDVLPDDTVPLGYVVRLRDRDCVREKLASQRFFCPVHWPLPAEVETNRFPDARQMSETLLTLPVDQRYGQDDMARLAHALKVLL